MRNILIAKQMMQAQLQQVMTLNQERGWLKPHHETCSKKTGRIILIIILLCVTLCQWKRPDTNYVSSCHTGFISKWNNSKDRKNKVDTNTSTVEVIGFWRLLKNEGSCRPARTKKTCSPLTQIGSTSVPSDWPVFVKARVVLYRRRSPSSRPLKNRPPFEHTRLPITSQASWDWRGGGGTDGGQQSRAKGSVCARATHQTRISNIERCAHALANSI